MVKAIIFDLDGTLCDTLDDIRDGVNAVLERLGYKTRTRQEIHKYINHGARNLIKRSLPKEVQNIDFIVESALSDYNLEYDNYYCNHTHPYEGIEEMLIELKSMGFKLGILSNKQDAYVKELAKQLIPDGICLAAYGSQNGIPAKPDPTIALALAKKLGVSPCECALIGDSQVDIKTANAAGFKVISVSWGYVSREKLRENGASVIIDCPQELLEIF